MTSSSVYTLLQAFIATDHLIHLIVFPDRFGVTLSGHVTNHCGPVHCHRLRSSSLYQVTALTSQQLMMHVDRFSVLPHFEQNTTGN